MACNQGDGEMLDDSDDLEPPKKQPCPPRPPISGNCICHKRNISGPLVQASRKSWNSLLLAAQIRKDETWPWEAFISESQNSKSAAVQSSGDMDVDFDRGSTHESTAGYGDIPVVYYHRECYQQYTSKTQLDRVRRRASIVQGIKQEHTT